MNTLTDLASAADESVANDAVIPITKAIVVAAFLMFDAPQSEVVFHQCDTSSDGSPAELRADTFDAANPQAAILEATYKKPVSLTGSRQPRPRPTWSSQAAPWRSPTGKRHSTLSESSNHLLLPTSWK
jgi:hypothetical protein